MTEASPITSLYVDEQIALLRFNNQPDAANLMQTLWAALCHARTRPAPALIAMISLEAGAAADCLRGRAVHVQSVGNAGPIGAPDVAEALHHVDHIARMVQRYPEPLPLSAFPAITERFLSSVLAENEPLERGIYMSIEDGPGRRRSAMVCQLGMLKQLAMIARERLAGATVACDDLRVSQESSDGNQA